MSVCESEEFVRDLAHPRDLDVLADIQDAVRAARAAGFQIITADLGIAPRSERWESLEGCCCPLAAVILGAPVGPEQSFMSDISKTLGVSKPWIYGFIEAIAWNTNPWNIQGYRDTEEVFRGACCGQALAVELQP